MFNPFCLTKHPEIPAEENELALLLHPTLPAAPSKQYDEEFALQQNRIVQSSSRLGQTLVSRSFNYPFV